MQALDNLRELGVPFRFNVTMIRDNLTQLEAIAALAAGKGARVVNFLTFNPYFEWERDIEISFQARHSEIAPYLMRAIDICTAAGVEANVRYMPPCQLPGYEQHVYTGFQLPYDPHEWDYNSWYDTGHPGQPRAGLVLPGIPAAAANGTTTSRSRPAPGARCAGSATGSTRSTPPAGAAAKPSPTPGPQVTDPRHFIRHQDKYQYPAAAGPRARPGRIAASGPRPGRSAWLPAAAQAHAAALPPGHERAVADQPRP